MVAASKNATKCTSCCEKGIFFSISTPKLVRNNMYWISFSKYDTDIDYMEYTQFKNICCAYAKRLGRTRFPQLFPVKPTLMQFPIGS